MHLEFAGTVQTLDVDSDGGTIHIEGTDDATATIDAEISDGLRSGHHDEQLQGDRLVVRATCPNFLSQWCGVEYTIHVPRDIAVTATSSDSSIVVTGIDGDVQLHSSDGGVTAGDLQSPNVTASSGDGHVQLTFAAAPTQVPRHLERRWRDRRRARHARPVPGHGVVIRRRHGRPRPHRPEQHPRDRRPLLRRARHGPLPVTRAPPTPRFRRRAPPARPDEGDSLCSLASPEPASRHRRLVLVAWIAVLAAAIAGGSALRPGAGPPTTTARRPC